MTLDELLIKTVNIDLVDIVLSNTKNKGDISKIKIRPVIIKDTLMFQATKTSGTKVFHTNYNENEIKENIAKWVINDFKQAQIITKNGIGNILSGKNGNVTIKYRTTVQPIKNQAQLTHNRSKKYIIEEGKPVDFLVELGVMTREGKVVNSKYDKFRQINRFLEFIEDILPQLSKDKEQTIIDFGCGKSYLTFAMYYYLKVLKGYDIRVIGLDLKEDVINKCNELKNRYQYNKLDFYVGDIASYKAVDSVDMVVTLHACDIATDYALAKAVMWGARVILSVPCCQHEANNQINSELLEPVLKYGILKERVSALITDAVRAQLLESKGYTAQILEFIDMEHTPKNLLIRAVKNLNTTQIDKKSNKDRLEDMEQSLGLNLTLNKLMNNIK